MADEDSVISDDFISERQRVAERFAALGGGSTLDMDLRKLPKLADLVTDQHRAMVMDLAAGGMSHASMARVMGISKERLQSLFDYELTVGFELAEATLSRVLYLKGVAGSDTAATNWLRYHKQGTWGDKKQINDGEAAATPENVTLIQNNNTFVNQVTLSISTDPRFHKATTDTLPRRSDTIDVQPKKLPPASRRKAKGD